MGRAINKAVTIAEILKRKMPLHQWNVLSSLEMIDLYEPIEEGLDLVENRRYVSCLTITLSLTLLPQQQGSSSSSAKVMDDTPPLDIHHFGYQPPLPITELQPPSSVTSYSHYNKPQQRQRQHQ
jgi:Alba